MPGASALIHCGLDGGGTGCRIRLVDARGRVLAERSGGPANVASDPGAAIANLRATLAEALAAAGGIDPACVIAHAGLAGVLDQATAQRVAASLPFARCDVSDDRLATLAGALGEADGMVFSAGTGSFAGVRAGGDVRFLGGWGWRLGDQASGAWLGRRALEAALLAHDGLDPPTGLMLSLQARFSGDPVRLVSETATWSPQDFASLAPEILDRARDGDRVAASLVRDGADYVGGCARALVAEGPIVLTGGVGPAYATFLPSELQDKLAPARGTALDGAVQLARTLAAAGP